MMSTKKVALLSIAALALTASGTLFASADESKNSQGKKNSSVTNQVRVTHIDDETRGIKGQGRIVSAVLADLVIKGSITAAQSKAITDNWLVFLKAAHTSAATPAPLTPGGIDPQLVLALNDLVTKGTITAAQSQLVQTGIINAIAFLKLDFKSNQIFIPRNTLAIVTSTFGIDTASVRTQLAGGASLAMIGGGKTAALIGALIADETKQIDSAVTLGWITAAQGATYKANLTAHVTAEVNLFGGVNLFVGKDKNSGKKGD